MNIPMPIKEAVTVLAACLTLPLAAESSASLIADCSAPQREVSKNLFGIFYEDINYAADGGLYGEMVQNRSFEFGESGRSPTEGWQDQLHISGEASQSRLIPTRQGGLNANNPSYVLFTAKKAGDGFANSGYKGMFLEAGKSYPASLWLKSDDESVSSVTLCLGAADPHAKQASARITGITKEWKKFECKLTAAETSSKGRLAIYADQAGRLSADFISLFAADIYKNEPNGLRKDLAELLEAMHPAFIRFPGGCIVHGHKLSDRYQWKKTIGPVEERKETPNFWGGAVAYQQSYGLGFYEYFRLCEDLGAEPIPVMSVGMSHDGEKSPASDYQWYAQDALDMIEWATGSASSKWGQLRAAAGHPEPFTLNYIGIGNEDCGGDYFERYKYIASAIKKRYPHIKPIISSGFTYNDINFHNTWKQVRDWEKKKKTQNLVALVDEHYYNPYSWFLTNGNRYDSLDFYPRGKDEPKVFIGEYASWVDGRRNNLFAALTEAAYMTSIERNGDIVEIASYAPLFAREGYVQWQPDAIWFNGSQSYASPNYYVQAMFMQHKSDYTIETSLTQPEMPDSTKKGIEGSIGIGSWATSAQFRAIKVTDSATGALIYSAQNAGDTSDFSPAGKSGDWKAEKGTFSQTSLAKPAFMALSEAAAGAGLHDYTLELEARKTGGAEGFLIGFGIQGEKLYWWNIGGWGNTQSCVEKGSLSGRSTIGDAKSLSLTSDKWYKIKVEVQGESYRCYLDGKLIHENTDPQNFQPLYAHVGRSEKGNIIIKLVNISDSSQNLAISLKGVKNIAPTASVTVLSGKGEDENSFDQPQRVTPRSEVFTGAGKNFTYTLLPCSLSILELQEEQQEE